MTAARTSLTEPLTEMTTAPVTLRAWRNRLTPTDYGIQLRLGPGAHWHPCLQQDDGDWWPAAPVDPGLSRHSPPSGSRQESWGHYAPSAVSEARPTPTALPGPADACSPKAPPTRPRMPLASGLSRFPGSS